MELYFYTHLESDSARKRVMALLDGKLILSDPSKFNDPFDCQLSFNHADLDSAEALSEQSLPNIRARLALIEGNPTRARQNIESRREAAFRRYRMFCFSESWDNCLMWSHYANRHQGICLKLNIEPGNIPQEDVLEPVRYQTHYPVPSGQKIVEYDEESLKTLLLTKSVDWLYEKEWRYIVKIASRDWRNRENQIDCSAWLNVKDIYFGNRFNENRLSVLIGNQLVELGSKNDRQRFSEVFEWIESDKIDELKSFFGDKWEIFGELIEGLIPREKMLMSLRCRPEVNLSKCEKSHNQFGLELNEFQYAPLQSPS